VFYGSDGLGLAGSSSLAEACAGLLGTHTGKPNNGLVAVWPRANDQGAWEIGFRPAQDLAHELQGKTVYIVAADPAGDDPQLGQALKSAKFVAVQELFLTETAKLAGVVLPAQAYTEREGSYTNAQRRVQRFSPAVPPRGEARPDYAITAAIARHLGAEMEATSAAALMDALAASVPAFAGISFRGLAEVTEQMPIVGRRDLYYGGTTYENKQGLGMQLAPAAQAESASMPAATLRPVDERWLAVPVTRLYDRGITVANSALLNAHIGEPFVMLHPDMAAKLGCAAGDGVVLDGVPAQVRLDDSVPASVVLVPRSMGFPSHAPAYADLKKA
jgi:NADH-quinone oxidoreductase subunit G